MEISTSVETETIESSDRTEANFWTWYSIAPIITPDFFNRLDSAMGQREMCYRYLKGKLPLIEREIDRTRKNRAGFLECFPFLAKTLNKSRLDESTPYDPRPKEKPQDSQSPTV